MRERWALASVDSVEHTLEAVKAHILDFEMFELWTRGEHMHAEIIQWRLHTTSSVGHHVLEAVPEETDERNCRVRFLSRSDDKSNGWTEPLRGRCGSNAGGSVVGHPAFAPPRLKPRADSRRDLRPRSRDQVARNRSNQL
jgi:hypothetical protein